MNASLNPLDHPDAEVTRAYFCQLTGRSKITAYRHEREDPDWPKPVKRGKRVFYKAVDCKRYLTSVHAQESGHSKSCDQCLRPALLMAVQ